ncbi:MAG: thioredoxin family protein [Acholeplasmatales bacterium]|nr:thioredoxin family protein [Acholeplasmatales bacterium]
MYNINAFNKKDIDEVLKGVCVIEVSGESCANCLTLMPILDRLVTPREGVKLVHIEADPTTEDLIKRFEIRQAPTILITLDGEIRERVVGFQPEEILEIWLDDKLQKLGK